MVEEKENSSSAGGASSLEVMIKEISKKSGTSAEEIKKLIEEKQDELSGLVSEEGAMHIVARELGVSLLKEKKWELKIANLVSGLRAVDIVGKIIGISEIREFERNGKKGQVLNVMLGDETGTVRMSMWNDEVDIIQKLGLKEGDCMKLTNGYVKIDNRDNTELRKGKGLLEKVDMQIEVPKSQAVDSFGAGAMSVPAVAKRQPIAGLKEGSFAEVRSSLVQLFRRNPFYNLCPTCEGRLTQKEEGGVTVWHCEEHGKVEPKKQLVLSGVIDDGTDNIRVVFFRDAGEKVFGKKTEELTKIAKEADDPFAIYDQFENLGKEFIISGRVKKNTFTDNIELVANNVSEIDIKKEAEGIIKEFGSLGKDSKA